MPREFVDQLSQLVSVRLPPDKRGWWAACAVAVPPGRIGATWAGLARRAGAEPLRLETAELAALTTAGLAGVSLQGRPLGEVARVSFLVRILPQLSADQHVRLVEELYRVGDLEEKLAVLRALALLPQPERFVNVAAEGVRTNAAVVLEAIACDNAFPARFLAPAHWNQMIMKTVFNNLPLARVLGLSDRCTPELARMAYDFACERRAAGRTVPADLGLIGLSAG